MKTRQKRKVKARLGRYQNPNKVGWLGWIEKKKEIVYIDLDGKLSKPYPNKGKFDSEFSDEEKIEIMKRKVSSKPFNPSNRYSGHLIVIQV